MSERDFSIGERKFKLSKIDVIRQFHIVRRLAPMIGDIIPVAHKLQKMGSFDVNQLTDAQAEALAPLINRSLDLFSKLPDQDAEMILKGLCSCIELHQPASNNWAKIVAGDMFAFQDLGLSLLLQCAGRAFMYNLGSFFDALPQVSHGGA
jgi:hypothetical protein